MSPGFVAYSASATIEAPAVYVNYGLPADYARVRTAGVEVRGRIVLARYGRSHRAVKVFTAQQEGAAGIVLYSDPADDGAARGPVWPDGRWRAAFQVQRGNAKYSWFWHGDPLTPGTAAKAGSAPLDPTTAPTLPRIPALVISADEAGRVLNRIEGPQAPDAFVGGLPVRYRLGPGPGALRMHVRMRNEINPIYDVIARIEGTARPERWVMLGTHHDAWTFGATDPGSAVAVLLEVARGLAALQKSGWRPARSLMFCFWDAEEFGLIGSSEFAEDRAREIREKAVAYINTDMYMAGTLAAGGVPSLRDFVGEVARDTPGDAGNLLADWRKAEHHRAPGGTPNGTTRGDDVPELRPLGSGADFVAFQDFLGLPTLSLELLTPSGWTFGTYHSAYDTRRWFERHGDPGYRQSPRLAQVLGRSAMRLSDSEILPFRYGHYGARVVEFVRMAEEWQTNTSLPFPETAMQGVRSIALEVQDAGRALDAAIDRYLEMPAGRTRACRPTLNDALARVEQSLLDTDGPANSQWYRHVLHGWNIYSLYDGQPLPRVADAIRRGEATAIQQEIARVQTALTRMRDALRHATDICR